MVPDHHAPFIRRRSADAYLEAMLAALRLVLTDDHNLLNIHLLPAAMTWGVIVGGLYGCGRLIVDVVRGLRRELKRPLDPPDQQDYTPWWKPRARP
jgi:hypothetical protein